MMAEQTTQPQTPMLNPALARLEGGAFLVEHAGAEQPEFPGSTIMIGADAMTERYSMRFYDARGSARIYQMRLQDGTWKHSANALLRNAVDLLALADDAIL